MKKRLYKNLVNAVISSLEQIFIEGKYADKVIEKTLKIDSRWGARDRAFIAETVYDLVRWRRLFSEVSGIKDHFNRKNIWKMFVAWAVVNEYYIPDKWDEITDVVPEGQIMKNYNRLRQERVYKESIPDWLDAIGVEELGEKWPMEISALNQQAPVVLRVNTLKTNRETLFNKLNADGVECVKLDSYPNALELTERKNIFTHKSFKDGHFEIQDASSQLVAEFLDVKPGMRVVDACAGAGGKSLHLASLMENKGLIISMDIYENKLAELKKRAKRNSAFNIETRHISNSKVIKRMQNSADRLLIDAPCSGLGVLKRNPDAKWKLKPEFLDEIRVTQKDILQQYNKILKPGGLMVYATCSILPSENQNQVEEFLKNNPNFKLLDSKIISPSQSGYDGFYMAKLQKIE